MLRARGGRRCPQGFCEKTFEDEGGEGGGGANPPRNNTRGEGWPALTPATHNTSDRRAEAAASKTTTTKEFRRGHADTRTLLRTPRILSRLLFFLFFSFRARLDLSPSLPGLRPDDMFARLLLVLLLSLPLPWQSCAFPAPSLVLAFRSSSFRLVSPLSPSLSPPPSLSLPSPLVATNLLGEVHFPQRPRPRRNRSSPAWRSLVRESVVRAGNLVYPLFIHDGSGDYDIESMPGCRRLALNNMLKEVGDGKASFHNNNKKDCSSPEGNKEGIHLDCFAEAPARLGSARLGSARLGSARLGSARLGSARLGSARLGSARLGLARLGSPWIANFLSLHRLA